MIGLCRSRRVGDDAGFTLIEAIVSLMVLGVVFTALAMTSIGTLRASMASRSEQQAVDFATQGMEKARDLEFDDLAHTTADLAGDSKVSTCGSQLCYDPGTGIPEVLVTSSTAGIIPHIETVTHTQANNVDFKVATYVTSPPNTNAGYRRVTVTTSWQVAGRSRSRSTSSLVAETTRGLPLPVFKLTPLGATSVSLNAGADAVFGFTLANQGAPDRWNLTFSGAAASDWKLYKDDGDGVWESSTVDTLLTNTSAPLDTDFDTGRIDPTGTVVFWAVRTVADTAAAGDNWSKLTAKSATQPTAATASASLDVLVRVVDGTITSNPGSGQVSTVPGAPVNLQVGTGNASLSATWAAPASAGTSAITDYVISYKIHANASSAWTTFADGVSTGTSATVTGLTNGTTYDMGVAAVSSAGAGAQALAQGMPEAPYAYLAPVKCSATALTASKASGYNLTTYFLHNRSSANPSWPGVGIPTATSTVTQGLPLVGAIDGAPQLPTGTILPVYSSDILPSESGRVVAQGGSLASTSTTQVADWRSTVGGKSFKGTAVLMLWVAPISTDNMALPWSISAEPYYRSSSGSIVSLGTTQTVSGAANSLSTGCTGWRQIYFSFSINKPSGIAANEYPGIRAWVPTVSGNMARLRLAYDVVGDFPATFIMPEK